MMEKIEDVEKDIEQLKNLLSKMKKSLKACEEVKETSKNEKLIWRAEACMAQLLDLEIDREELANKIKRSHVCCFEDEKKGWILELNDTEYELYKLIKVSFNEVSFVFSYTKYEEYDTGKFFRRS